VSDRRKHRLIECNPSWVSANGVDCAIRFDCPEGHTECIHVIPFTPALDGATVAPESWYGRNGAVWQREGSTFESITLSPSILRRQQYPSREAAIADGCIPEHVTESMTCGLHIFIQNGAITFCGDSK